MNYNRFLTARSLRRVKRVKKKVKSKWMTSDTTVIPMPKRNKKPKTKPKQYPLDAYIEQIWYDDWLKKHEAKGVVIDGKHFWKVGGSI